jgi:transcriptional regulator with XRE-family HTH domain
MNISAPETLYELLQRLRRKARITQKDLAHELGVSQPLLSQIERGHVNNDMLCIRAIRLLNCQALGDTYTH